MTKRSSNSEESAANASPETAPDSTVDASAAGGSGANTGPATEAPRASHDEEAYLDLEAAEVHMPPAADPRDDEIASLKDAVARARADYQNLQRRVERDAALERERVKARVLEGFLKVFEYGRMAAAEAEKSPGPLAEGIKLVVREFERLLEAEGVKTIGTIGEAFDPAHHEALAEEPADGVEPGRVSRIIQPGYLLGTRVLHYAKVAVAPAA